MLMIGRPVDPQILDYMAAHRAGGRRISAAGREPFLVADRFRLDLRAGGVAGAVGGGADRPGASPTRSPGRSARLINAAERVRGGDLAVRVPEIATRDEIAGLSRAFNRMTGQLAAQRAELMDAYSQIDERRRFTETVLSGVSAGRDRPRRRRAGSSCPTAPRTSCSSIDLMAASRPPLAEVVPELRR